MFVLVLICVYVCLPRGTKGSKRLADCKLLRVGQNHIFIRIYGEHTVFLAGKSPYIRSYMVYIYGSGQP